MEHINAKEQMIKKNLLKVVRFVDGDGITLQVSGASVHLDMEVEELMDQLTEDVDFYEYFERNMD